MMTPDNRDQLAAWAARLGVSLDDAALDRFDRYLALLERWNARINLTRIEGEAAVVAKHFLDSLSIVPYLGGAERLVDVGAGAGFPGIPAAIARPGLAVTLVESIQKKCAFLEAVKRELGLPLTVVTERVERFVGRAAAFDVAVSRATFAPAEWLSRGASLVAPGGVLIAMLGRERPALHAPAGFSAPELITYELPAEATRALAVLIRGR